MWLIARRTFAQNWLRLIATAIAIALSVGLMSGTLQFVQRAQRALTGTSAVEYRAADILVSSQTNNEEDAATPRTTISLSKVQRITGVERAVGDVAIETAILGASGEPVQGVGGAVTSLRPWIADPKLSSYRLSDGRAPAKPDEVVLGKQLAEQGGLQIGDFTSLLLTNETKKVAIVGIVTVEGSGAAISGDLVLGDPATVQMIARLANDSWGRIFVDTKPGVDQRQLVSELQQALGADFRVQSATKARDAELSSVQAASASLAGGLSVMGLMSVVVGLFVVANTFGTLVRQRGRQLALLAAIGAKPRQIKRLVRLEALALAVVGSVGGMGLAFVVAEAFTQILAKDGFDVSAVAMPFGVVNIGAALLAGIVTTQIAAGRAAKQASNVAAIDALRSSTTEATPGKRKRIIWAVIVALSSSMFFGPIFAIRADKSLVGVERTLVTAMMVALGAILVVSAIGILAPFFVGPVGGAIGQIGQALTGESGRLARATIMRNPRRISSAASSLMISVCMCATTMLIVFGAVARYNESGQQTLLADSVVSSGRKGLTSALPADVAKLTSGAPGVVAAEGTTQSTVRLVEPLTTSMKSTDLVDLDSEDEMDDNGPIDIAVTGLDNPSTFLKLEGLTTAPALGEIALSRGRLQAAQLKVGDNITVSAAAGKVRLRVIDDYRDISHLFADDALVSSATMQLLDPEAPTTAVFVRGGSPDTLSRHLGNVARVSDRSSYITIARQANVSGITLIYAFLGLTVIISLFGMATTISMNLFERTKEFGTLGAIGATQRMIRSIVYWETATVVALGVGTGLLEAFGIVHLIHLLTGSSFVRIYSPVPVIAGMTLIGAALTFAMSVLPARRATQVSILEATRSA